MRRFLPVLSLMCIVMLTTGCVPESYFFEGEIGSQGSGRGELLGGTDMELLNSGELLVCDSGNTRFQIINPKDGSVKVTGGEFGSTGFKLQGITGCTVNKLTQDIFICDYRGHKIVKFNQSGTPILKVTEKVKFPMDVATDKSGNIYVVFSRQPAIHKYNMMGAFIGSIGGSGKGALVHPTSIQIVNESIYVTDYGTRRVVKMTMSGEVEQEYTKKGEFEQIKGPSSVFVDSMGNIFLLDLGEVPVVLLDAKGELISKIGAIGKETGQFLYPRGIAANPEGQVFVLDNSRNVIIKYKKSTGK
ncbi:MAG: NHL repeat-containing protein [Candidatus Riflebacteria bacterium]|nr:NHL repeat-containing protein [Candidatus Riflebacteria bacterium]